MAKKPATTNNPAVVTIGGTDYELVLTTRATREIAARYGGAGKPRSGTGNQ